MDVYTFLKQYSKLPQCKCPRLTPCVRYCNILAISRPKLMDSPVSCQRPIIQYIHSHPQYLEVASSIHKQRMHNTMVTADPINHRHTNQRCLVIPATKLCMVAPTIFSIITAIFPLHSKMCISSHASRI